MIPKTCDKTLWSKQKTCMLHVPYQFTSAINTNERNNCPRARSFLTFTSLTVSLRATKVNIQQILVLPTQCIYMFCTDLRIDSDFCFIYN